MRQHGSQMNDYVDVPSSINVTVANSPNSNTIMTFIIHTGALLCPVFSKDLLRKLSRLGDCGRVIIIEYIHDFIGDRKRLVLKWGVSRQCVYKLSQGCEIP